MFHSDGINIKEIGSVSKAIKNTLLKSYLKSEIAARVIKTLFRKKMHNQIEQLRGFDQIIEGDGSGRILSDRRIVKEFLNSILGTGENHFEIWKVITLHSQVIFSESVSPK